MRVPVTVNAPNAVYNARHFWYRRGITIVAHAADIWMPFYPQVMQDISEALYVIDALCHHETDFDIQEHYTDTASATIPGRILSPPITKPRLSVRPV
jgi:TnpA family transposase